MSLLNSDRNVALDIARALCTIEIIAFWHALNYMDLETDFMLTYGVLLTRFSLSVFTFLSGFFLSKYTIRNGKDVICFYRKRLLRFFPLFFISCISLYIGGELVNHSWFDSIFQFLMTVIGLGVFYPPMAGTVWYISMLMLFYLITPFILLKFCNKWVACSVFFLIFILVSRIIPVDDRLIIYYPFYALGLCINKKIIKRESLLNKKQGITILICGGGSLLLCVFYGTIFKGLLFYMILLIGGISVIAISIGISKINVTVNRIGRILAYSSMAAYLFHRQVYECFRMISPNHIVPICLMLLAIGCVFVFSFYIQRIYDCFCSKYLV